MGPSIARSLESDPSESFNSTGHLSFVLEGLWYNIQKNWSPCACSHGYYLATFSKNCTNLICKGSNLIWKLLWSPRLCQWYWKQQFYRAFFRFFRQFLRKLEPKFEQNEEQLSNHGSKLSNHLELGLDRTSAKNQQTKSSWLCLNWMAECEGKQCSVLGNSNTAIIWLVARSGQVDFDWLPVGPNEYY